MGERDNHIVIGTSLSTKDELLTHGHGEKERVVDEEVQPEGDEGGCGHDPWGKRPLAPSSSLEMVLVWRWVFSGG